MYTCSKLNPSIFHEDFVVCISLILFSLMPPTTDFHWERPYPSTLPILAISIFSYTSVPVVVISILILSKTRLGQLGLNRYLFSCCKTCLLPYD
ncbi:hypothetical protein GGR53DRAFT_478342 [Hypoxylon sp. FL1150]|nr:hypothetical protein GGR53DRAFT_478342 [Hypoxylon sp. FL1150]